MELFDIKQLRAFHSLAKTRSFTQAARRLVVTQSAISHSIKTLETSLHCQLFDRTGKSVDLTGHGHLLLRRTERIFEEMKSANDELSSLGTSGLARLRIGSTMTMCHYLLPAVLLKFRENFPRCDIRIEPGDSEYLQGILASGEIDLALGLRTPGSSRFDVRPLLSDQMSLVVAPTHPWAKQQELKRQDFEKERFIVYGRKTHTYRLIESYFKKQGIVLNSPLELGSMEAIKELAKIGLGIGVVAPWITREEIDQGSLVARDIAKPKLKRQWALFSKRQRPLSLAEETFASICEIVAPSLGSAIPSPLEGTA